MIFHFVRHLVIKKCLVKLWWCCVFWEVCVSSLSVDMEVGTCEPVPPLPCFQKDHYQRRACTQYRAQALNVCRWFSFILSSFGWRGRGVEILCSAHPLDAGRWAAPSNAYFTSSLHSLFVLVFDLCSAAPPCG